MEMKNIWQNKSFSILIVSFFFLILCDNSFAQENVNKSQLSPYAKLKETSIGDVSWTKGFWKDRFDQAYKVTIPHLHKYFEGRANEIGHSGLGSNKTLNNFRIAAGLQDGKFNGSKWGDGDFYKWIEGVANVYALTKDQSLDSLMDGIISIIGKAQQENGYIDTRITITGEPRFVDVQEHETYNMGHLIIASCAHYKATGKTNFLEIGKKAADCLYQTFIDPSVHFIGYTSIMGLAELYRVTEEKKYLDLALEFINKQGNGEVKSDQTQDRTPIREESQALGHAVWGTYFYCGIEDVYAETGEKALFDAMDRIWHDLHEKKYYITGGVSAAHRTTTPSGDKVHEAFGEPYDLPNAGASNECCSHIGDAMWNFRLLKLTGDSKYADIMETILYNSFLAGIGLEGVSYFYTNPLERFGIHGVFDEDDTMIRWLHRGGFCCPPNLLRTVTGVNNWAYSVSKEGVYVNLYGSNTLTTKLFDGSDIEIVQETNYPWDGDIKLSFTVSEPKEFSIMLRIPQWATGAEVSVNGELLKENIKEGSYFKIEQTWNPGDIVNVKLPMDVKIVRDNPLVKENINKVAIKRGPIVYCAESPDLPGGIHVKDIAISANTKFTPIYDEYLLKGVTVLEGQVSVKNTQGKAEKVDEGFQQSMKHVKIRLVPYYTWANRGISDMSVWIPVKTKK